MKNSNKYLTRIAFCIFALLCFNSIASGQLVANFSADPTTGCAPLLVRFTDNSTGNPTSWNWDLGNGTFSTQKNPVTTYTVGGIYTVKLTVGNGSTTNSISKNQYITVYDKPAVKFSVTDSIDCIPFTTSFKDLSTVTVGTVINWQWDFDDGATSLIQNPSHLYNISGNYNITLTVTSSGGCSNSLSKLAYIKANDSIRTLFTFTKPLKCNPPELIRFTNNTLGPGPLSYKWDFGDGTTSTNLSPSHNYLTGGTYSLKLMVSNNIGCRDTLVYKDTLVIKDVQPAITGPDTVCANKLISFTNGTVPAALSSRWSFSDGGSASGSSITKSWITPGNYSIKLVSNYPTCSDSIVKPVVVTGFPFFDFSSSDTFGCKVPFTVNFTDLSVGAVNWLWNFGDGNTSTQQNPSHTYTTEGIYTVRLQATNGAGCAGNILETDFIRVHKPKVAFNNTDGGGCIPYAFQPIPVAYAPDGIAGYFWDFGNGTSSSAQYPVGIYPDSGTYDVKLVITSMDGCKDSTIEISAVRTGNKPIIDFAGVPQIVCPGTSVQFTDLSHPADRWKWTFNDGSPSLSQNPSHVFNDSGFHAVKLVAWNNGCKDSLQKNKYIKVAPGRAAFKPFYDCVNKKQVHFADSSQGAQTWSWNFGDGNTSTLQNPTHTFSNFQNYTVSLTTTYDTCTSTDTMIVSILNDIPDFTSPVKKLCKFQTANFYISGINKADITSYYWDFGDGSTSTQGDSAAHAYTNAGTYTTSLTITKQNGCSETITKTNFIEVFAPHAGFKLNSVGGCANKIVNFIDTSSTANNINNIARWYWDFGDGTTGLYVPPTPNPVTHVYTAMGNYYPSLIIVDSVGCADTAFYSTPVKIGQPVANFFSPNYNTCTVDTVIFRNPSSGERLTYLWNFGDGDFSTDSLPKKNYTANGNYSIKLVVTDAFGCKDSMTRVNYIKVRDVDASFTVSDSLGTCTPFKASFTNTSINSLSQLWDFGDGGFSSTANPVYYYTTPGTYYAKLTAKRSALCFNSDSIKIVITAPRGTLTYAPVEGCAPLAVSFHVSTPDSVNFVWDFNDGITYESTDSNQVHTFTSPGSFVPVVLLLDTTAGCVVALNGNDTINLYNSKVNFSASDTLLCNSGITYFSDSTFSGSPISNLLWDFGDGNASNLQNPSHYYNTTGAFTIKLFINTIYGCRDSLIKPGYIKVAIKPDVNIAGNNNSYCSASTVTFTGNLLSTDTSLIKWKWNFGNGNSSVIQNPLPQTYNDTGLYTVQLIAAASNGCFDTAYANLNIYPSPNTYAGKDTVVCLGNDIQLSGIGADSYTWYPAIGLSCTSCNNPVATVSDNTFYYVKGTNVFGCEKVDSVFVNVKKPFVIDIVKNEETVCLGKSILLNAAGAENYSWTPAAGLNSVTSPNVSASPVTNTLYIVTGFDSSNCFTDTASVFVKVNSNPVVYAGADQTINAGGSTTLLPQYSNDVNSLLWQPATDLSCTTCPNPVASPHNNTTYILTVTSNNGCTATDDIIITVRCDNNSLYIPTAFTPNNRDGNNYFYPLSTGLIKISSFKIFNRSGQLIFQRGNFYANDMTKGWDGKFNGAEQPVGTYVYTLEFICANNQPVIKNGNILLLR